MVLEVQAAYGFKGGAAAGEKVQDEGVFFGAGYFYKVFYKRDRLGVVKGVFFSQQLV